MAWNGNPIDTLEPLAMAGIPLIYVVGDADTVVPAEENSLVIEQLYRKLGGIVNVIHKPGVDHHPHGLDDPTPVVNFIVDATIPRSSTIHPREMTVETIPLPGLRIKGKSATAHTQGLEIHSGSYHVTARRDDLKPRRALLLRTDASRSDWDVWDITPLDADGHPTSLDHPGGMQSDGNRLWIPLAESRRSGRSLIRAFPLAGMAPGRPLKWEVEISILDHIGAVAVDANRQRIYGASWDTEKVYIWDFEGKLQRSMSGLELGNRELGIAYKTARETGLAVQDWKVSEQRLFASGLFRGVENSPRIPQSRLTSYVGFDEKGFSSHSVSLPRQNSTELAREGMAVSDGWIYFLPEDLGTANRMYRLSLDDMEQR